MSVRRVAAIACGAWLAAAVVSGQSRDVATRRPASAAIEGIVSTTPDGAMPVRRAIVSVRGAGLQSDMQTTTDERGHFTLSPLPSGSFTLSATKPGFVPVTYGAREAPQTGTPIALVDGQRVVVSLVMSRGAVVAGRVFGIDGLSASSTSVRVLAVRHVAGERVLEAAGAGAFAAVDDRGQYRIFGLRAGTYVVLVEPRVGWSDVRLTSPAEWAFSQLDPDRASRTPPPPRGSAIGYAPVFFPGAADPSAADLITLHAGETREGVDVAIELVPTATLSGIVNAETGDLPSGIRLSLARMPANVVNQSSSRQVAVRPDGSFSAPGLAPGRYRLTATTTGTAAPYRWDMREVILKGEDTRVALTMRPGLSIAGRVDVSGANGEPPQNVSVSAVAVGSAGEASTVAGTVKVGADGRFAVPNLIAGPYRLSVGLPAMSGWYVASALSDGKDLIDVPTDVQSDAGLSDVVIRLTNRPTQLSGRVMTDAGEITESITVVVFAKDEAFWRGDSRRVRQVHVATDGRYAMTGLAPGEYRLAAVREMTLADLDDPGFYRGLLPAALPLTLAEGDVRSLDLRIRR